MKRNVHDLWIEGHVHACWLNINMKYDIEQNDIVNK